MNTEQAIKKFTLLLARVPEGNVFFGCEKSELWRAALAALRAQQKRECTKPLTLDELKERVGKPVYTVLLDEPGEYIPNDAWWDVLVDIRGDAALFRSGHMRGIDTLGKTWLAYDHEPTERCEGEG